MFTILISKKLYGKVQIFSFYSVNRPADYIASSSMTLSDIFLDDEKYSI